MIAEVQLFPSANTTIYRKYITGITWYYCNYSVVMPETAKHKLVKSGMNQSLSLHSC